MKTINNKDASFLINTIDSLIRENIKSIEEYNSIIGVDGLNKAWVVRRISGLRAHCNRLARIKNKLS